MRRRTLLALAAVLATAAVLVAASGGVRTTVGGFRVSARSPFTPGVAAAACLAAWALAAHRRRRIVADLEEAWDGVSRRAPALVFAVAAASAGTAAWCGTFAAAGADASGYLSQAALWATGQTGHVDPLSSLDVVQANRWLTTPLGWRPALTAGVQVPTYPPGLPLLMAVPHLLGGTRAAALVVVAAALCAVWATGALAARLAGGVAGVVAAVLLSVAPAFLFQSVQPMSDVPVTAAWAVCWLLMARSAYAGAGIACAVAVLVRPNLAPLAMVPFLVAWAIPKARPPATGRPAVLFAMPVAAAGVWLAWIQWRWYGSPLQSGYGSMDGLFAVANLVPNVQHYAGWLLETSPVLLLAPLGLWRHRQSPLAWGVAVFAAGVVGAYLPYGVFDDWSYLRFLLPALAAAAVLAGIACGAGVSALPIAWRAPILVGGLLVVVAHGVVQARARDVFDLAARVGRVPALCAAIEARLSGSGAIVAGEQSGAVRYYTGRSIVRWDAADAGELRRALDALASQGRDVWIALDAWEEPLFRARFAGLPPAALDWPPALEAGDTHRTRAWRIADRDRFLTGAHVPTERIR